LPIGTLKLRVESTHTVGTIKSYTIRGLLDTPDERNPTIVVVWFIEKGEDVPRLVTAYPG
jgi:hypothetical protein